MSKKERMSSGVELPDSHRERVASTLNGEGAKPTHAQLLTEFKRELREIRRENDRCDAPIVARAFRTWAEMDVADEAAADSAK